jgi:hypothetical protein
MKAGLRRCGLGFMALGILAVNMTGCRGPSAGGGVRDSLPVGCVVTPGTESCRGSQVGFYYDYRDDRCKPTYGSCLGRAPFPTLQSCVDFCGAKP